jgi:lipoprotein-anchoring transpeptidase ErfK/SrfK
MRMHIWLISGPLAFLVATSHVYATGAVIYGGMGDGGGTSLNLDFSRSPRKPVSLEVKIVDLDRSLEPGSILVSTGERKLYFILAGGKAEMYPVGVGREGFSWSGQNVITNKAEWPDWRPPAAMKKREAQRGRILPNLVKGGPQSPLGARALYIGDTEYRIHGTSQPWTIGRAVSSGCIRMLNEHVIALYQKVGIGAKVVVE